MASSASAEQEITFGAFRLLQAQRLLIEGDRPVPVGSRALALLFALVERAGEVLSKEELFAKVWPDTFVEEGNLRVHIAALRRALNGGRQGNRCVVTVPRRGYSFVAPTAFGRPAEPPVAPSASHNLRPVLPGMVGRDDIVRILVDQILGLTLHALRGLIAFLKSKELLLVLDNCEHVIEPAAVPIRVRGRRIARANPASRLRGCSKAATAAAEARRSPQGSASTFEVTDDLHPLTRA